MAEDLMNNKKSAGIDKKCTNAKGKEKETCMTSARTTWIKVVAMYFSANMTNLGTGLVVLAIVLLIIMFLACCSCCQHKHILEGLRARDSRETVGNEMQEIEDDIMRQVPAACRGQRPAGASASAVCRG